MNKLGVHQFYLMQKRLSRLKKTETFRLMLQKNCNTPKVGIALVQAYFIPEITESTPINISRIKINFLK